MASSSASNLRLMSDLKTMKQSPPEGVSASPLGDDNLHVWGGTIFGTDDTPWEGGIFAMRLTFPEQYPDKPPRVRFTSEMVREQMHVLGMCMLHVTPRPAGRAAHAGRWQRLGSVGSAAALHRVCLRGLSSPLHRPLTG